MTHTPGPWSCDYGNFSVYCETGAEVCEVTPGNHDDHTAISVEEMQANARLIAAAPELLATLKEAYDALDYAQAQVASDTDRWHLTRCRRKLKPVIDRAEGRP